MLKIKVLLLSSAIFAFCESSSIGAIINQRCRVTDDECYKEKFSTLMKEVAINGIKDLNIPIADPYEYKNIVVTPLGMLKIVNKEGNVTGLTTCTCNNYKTNMETKVVSIEIFCDSLSIAGKYELSSTGPLLALTGGISIHGEGTGSGVIEKLQVAANLPFDIIKHDDGEIYYRLKSDEVTSTFKILGKATLVADNILVGKQEISTVVVNIFNENWKVLMETFGNLYINEAIKVGCEFVSKLFDGTPAKEVTIDDLSSYVS